MPRNNRLHKKQEGQGAFLKVLLVDDHTLFREGLALILAGIGPSLEVLHAASMDQAIEQLAREPELVLLDLTIPPHTGLNALRHFRQHADHLPVVVITGDQDVATIRACIDAGAMGYIPKTSDARTLMAALREVIAGSVYLPPMAELDERAPDVAQTLGLTPRQLEVLAGIVQGKTNKRIAADLGINDATVKSHVSAVLQALGASNRTEAVYAVRHLKLR